MRDAYAYENAPKKSKKGGEVTVNYRKWARESFPQYIPKCFGDLVLIDKDRAIADVIDLDITNSISSIIDVNRKAFVAICTYFDEEANEYHTSVVCEKPGISSRCKQKLNDRLNWITKSVKSKEEFGNQFFHCAGQNTHDFGKTTYIGSLREHVGHAKLFSFAAGALIMDGNRILLHKRGDNGMWGIPGGGVEPGEEIRIAAIREIQEETGYHVKINRLLSVNSEEENNITYPNGDRIKFIGVLFSCEIIGGAEYIDNHETIDLRWFDPDDLPGPLGSYAKRHIHDYLSDTVLLN